MNDLLIGDKKELEKYIRGKVVEEEGSRVDESANIYFRYSRSLDNEVTASRLKTEEAARLRYISALCTARKVTEIIRNHNIWSR